MFTEFDKRMKRYEQPFQQYLPIKMPIIIRLDGRSFHTFTQGFSSFSPEIMQSMKAATEALMNEIQGAKLAYSQSDEISILLTDYDDTQTQAWFDYNVQKLVSISASIATAAFNYNFRSIKLAHFDSRCFVLPQDEVENYFIWREADCTRNSVMSLARDYFSHKELNKIKTQDIKQKLLEEKNVSWELMDAWKKRGWCYYDDHFDMEIPIFSENREFIKKYVYLEKQLNPTKITKKYVYLDVDDYYKEEEGK